MTVSLERPSRITELGAVNFMLRAIGEAPVSSLTAGSKTSAVKAQQILGEQSMVVQSESWNFVVEETVTLTPNPTTGFVYLPENIVAMAPKDRNYYDSLQEVGGRVYNAKDNTFVFSDPVILSLTLARPFEELPQPARWYITVLSALQLINSEEPGSSAMRVTAADLEDAKRRLEVYDRRLKRGGLRRHNSHFKRLRGNR